MKKRTLNLEILELEQLDNKQAAVSLMPCPCGASGGGKAVGIGVGLYLGEVIDNLQAGTVAPPPGVPCTGSMSPCGGTCGSDADFAAINAEIAANEANESQAGGGGK